MSTTTTPAPAVASLEESHAYNELEKGEGSDAGDAVDFIPQAAIMPDGQLVMLSPENPLAPQNLAQATSEAGSTNEIPVMQFSMAAMQQIYQPALQLERMARVVRLLAMFDMTFSLMHAVSDMWPAAIAAIMSYCGYLGARTFRRDLTRIYLLYLMLFAFARVLLSARYSIAVEDAPPSLPIYMSLTALVQLIISHFVWRFYCLLPTSNEQARLVQFFSEQYSHHAFAV